jgi:hypothetical protein
MAVTSSTFNAQDDRARDALFIGKVRQAMLTSAIAIQNEASSVALHANRAVFAYEVLRDPNRWAPIMAQGVASDATIADDATDAAIQTSLNARWNAYAVPVVT